MACLCASVVVASCAGPQPLVRQEWRTQPRQRLGVVPLFYEVQTHATMPQHIQAFQQETAQRYGQLTHLVQALLRDKSFTLLNQPQVYQVLVQHGTLDDTRRSSLDFAINSLVDANILVANRLYNGVGPPLAVSVGESVRALPQVLGVEPEAWLWLIITGSKERTGSYAKRMGLQTLWAVVTLVATLGFAMLVPNPQRGHHFIASALVVEPTTGEVLWWNRLTSSGDPLDVNGDVRSVLASILKELAP